ncbi:PEP-CTERM sorting domain-containing protein [Chitinivorax sp. B]|uniref:PEP-CTERM sorting domain-containing protein n=1 Tax=Chitinivorax sp. B TaxID=2502235 RepID=UPI0010F82F56|nr:PEP-CTERM sorting domain-containing protein [Chitinivorax sp. B]
MFKASIIATAITAASFSGSAFAGFINGDFELGNTTGWTMGSGSRSSVTNANLNPSAFLPGGNRYSNGMVHSSIVSSGTAPHTDGKLNQVYSGQYSMRVEDTTYGGYASVITQKVSNYNDKEIFFAWAAVLEGAHGTNEAATFQLVLRDETVGKNLIKREYNAATGGSGVDGRFTKSSDGYFYTSWQVEQMALEADAIGHDLSLTLLAADCSPTGHAGYVYLDGFGRVAPPTGVPVPGVLALMGLGLTGLAVARRRKA